MATNWHVALRYFSTRRTLQTVARKSRFDVESDGLSLIIIPATGKPRAIHQAEFDRVVPLLAERASAAELQEATFNSSYLRAIAQVLERQP